MLSRWDRWSAERPQGLDRLIFRVVAYALPLFLLFACVLAWSNWPSADPVAIESPLPFRALSDAQNALQHSQAVPQLARAPEQLQLSTRRATHAFWLQLDLRDASTEWLEFPSRHATTLACWRDGALLGQADRTGASGLLKPVRGGFALELPLAQRQGTLTCRASFLGPTGLSVLARSTEALQAASARFNREAGLLDGGLITLSLFLFVTALIHRNTT